MGKALSGKLSCPCDRSCLCTDSVCGLKIQNKLLVSCGSISLLFLFAFSSVSIIVNGSLHGKSFGLQIIKTDSERTSGQLPVAS